MVSKPGILITNGRIIDPSSGYDRNGDLLINNGTIIAREAHIEKESLSDVIVVDAGGLIVCPGFIDLHCHLREPGFEYKETISTGTRAAARGGFTTLCSMPNTEPAIDNVAVVDYIRAKTVEDGVVRVWPIGCVTKGRKGYELSEMEELAIAGVVAFSDDGDPVWDSNIMRLALAYSKDLGLPISNHCQDHTLSKGGVMCEGPVSTRLGLPGIPAAAEEAMVARDIALAELTGGKLHVAHLSTAGSVALVREAKNRGLSITAEVCPHHLLLTDERVLTSSDDMNGISPNDSYDTSTKVYPPLRTSNDVRALIDGLNEGVIDCIATDHAPHDIASKQVTYEEASFGISVLETAVGSLCQLVHSGQLSLSTLIDRLTVGPAKVLGAQCDAYKSLEPNTAADLVLIDPDKEWTVDSELFVSKGRNTPLNGATLRGLVQMTIVDGGIVYQGPDVGGKE